jgi:mRNA-degrading endonuclease RelE of RelBE toxin-antitoxin system
MSKPLVSVVQTSRFAKDLNRLRRKYPLVDHDVLRLIERLEAGELPGDRMPGLPFRVYKERIPNTSARRGERGGFRTIYYVQTATFILLITIYSKSEQSDIRPEVIRDVIAEYERDYGDDAQ